MKERTVLPLPRAANVACGVAILFLPAFARFCLLPSEGAGNPPGASAAELKARTLTNLYNARPRWLELATELSYKRLAEALMAISSLSASQGPGQFILARRPYTMPESKTRKKPTAKKIETSGGNLEITR